jgi:hypothetical protein
MAVGNFNSSDPFVPAVTGESDSLNGIGVSGSCIINGPGVRGFSSGGNGVEGNSNGGNGVVGSSSGGYGVSGSGGDIGVYAQNLATPGNVVYLATRGLAGDFRGDVVVSGNGSFGNVATSGNGNFGNVAVSGNVTVSGDVILNGGDCAEEFDIAEAGDIEPGTVMVLDQDGALHQSQHAYDKRVAGVVSGAGDYKPGLILDRQQSRDNRVAVALVGKVYCKVDAQYAPIEVGDLLTTSPTQGHAMKADDPFKAFGSVIGKALRPLKAGREMIPILIALQ